MIYITLRPTMNRIIKFFLIAGVVYLCAEWIGDIHVAGYKNAIIAALVLAVVNVLIRPILQFISLPITILTFGLFYFVINALMIMLMDYFVDGFGVTNFWWALLLSLILSFASGVIDKILKREPER